MTKLNGHLHQSPYVQAPQFFCVFVSVGLFKRVLLHIYSHASAEGLGEQSKVHLHLQRSRERDGHFRIQVSFKGRYLPICLSVRKGQAREGDHLNLGDLTHQSGRLNLTNFSPTKDVFFFQKYNLKPSFIAQS